MPHGQLAIEQLEARQLLTAVADTAPGDSLPDDATTSGENTNSQSAAEQVPAITSALLELSAQHSIEDILPHFDVQSSHYHSVAATSQRIENTAEIVRSQQQFIVPSYASSDSTSKPLWEFNVVDLPALSKSAQAKQDVRLHEISSQFAAATPSSMSHAHWLVQQYGSWKVYSRFGSENGIPIVGDFNGDGISEFGIYESGQWFIDANGNGLWDQEDVLVSLGNSSDLPVVGDWNGDGRDDIGVFKATENTHTDAPSQHPVAGDFNGDGVATVGEFRDGNWQLKGAQRTDRRHVDFVFGDAGDVPVVGDWNGDGIDEVGVYRQGKFILDANGNRAMDAADLVFQTGGPGDLPVAGNFDGDGDDEPAVYRSQPHERTARSGG
jgi:hypothetical protein